MNLKPPAARVLEAAAVHTAQKLVEQVVERVKARRSIVTRLDALEKSIEALNKARHEGP